MTKKKLIEHINNEYNATLTRDNTSMNLLLKTEDVVFWIVLPVCFLDSIEKTFRIRHNKDLVDLEINAGRSNFLCDVKSGGFGFSFGEFVKEEINVI